MSALDDLIEKEIRLVEFAGLIDKQYEFYQEHNGNFKRMIKIVALQLPEKFEKDALCDDIVKNLNISNRNWSHFCNVLSGNVEYVNNLAIRMMDNIDYAIDGVPDYEAFHDCFLEANKSLIYDVNLKFDKAKDQICKYPKYMKYVGRSFREIHKLF